VLGTLEERIDEMIEDKKTGWSIAQSGMNPG